MSDDSVSRLAKWLTLGLLLGWAVAFFGSFATFYLTPSQDFGLSAGWNKVGVFMGWQAVASVLAIAVLAVCRTMPAGSALRRAGWAPPAAFGLMFAALAGLLIWANMQRSPPEAGTPPRPATAVTAPVDG